jgi:hypothetical protein
MDPGSGYFSIPDPGVKRAPDPGSGSAKLSFRIKKHKEEKVYSGDKRPTTNFRVHLYLERDSIVV